MPVADATNFAGAWILDLKIAGFFLNFNKDSMPYLKHFQKHKKQRTVLLYRSLIIF